MVKKIDTAKVNYNSPVFKLLLAVDQLACDMETKWGTGTLYRIAGKEVEDKFMARQDKMVDAINGGDYDTAKEACEHVKKGWHRLEQIAKDAGYEKDVDYRIMVNASGVEYWLVKDDIDSRLLAARNPAKASAIVTGEFVVDLLCTALTPNQTGSLGEYHRIMSKQTPMGEIIEDSIPW